MKAARHPKEEERLAALRRYEILDTPNEPAFDDVVRLVAHICQAPIAVVNLIDAGRQWFKAEVGLGVRETPLDPSICAHALLQPGTFIVNDTLNDPRFKDNPLVTGDPRLRFYAGALLETPEHLPIGTLCVLDFQPRDLDESQKEALEVLARQVMAQLELRRHIARQKAQLDQERRLREALQVTEKAKDRFLAALSHELRTPLAPVLMIARSLEADESLPQHVRDDLHVLATNAEMEVRLIDDLLDVTRVVHGKLHLDRARCDVHDVIRQARHTCRSADARAAGAKIELELRATRAQIDGDGMRLQQVIWNLLKNAIKFSPEGSPIHVRTRDAQGDGIAIEIADRGAGIDPAILPTIFNAFEQGGSDVTRRFGGLGLGLAISKAIVDLHGGTLSAHSAGNNLGATFTITLAPAYASSAVAEPAPAAPRDQRIQPMRILLVEDHEGTAHVMSRLLRKMSHEVQTAGTLRDALHAAKESKGKLDLVISDLGLPDGTGYELMQSLQSQYNLPGIALSGYGMDEDVQKSVASGFSFHLTKPVDLKDLTKAIGQVAEAASQ